MAKVPSKYDKSDQKALNALIETLNEAKKAASQRSGAETSGKRAPKRGTVGSPGSKRKRSKIANNAKITTWLNKENAKDKKETKKKFERTPSFEKYGVVLPSYEKILEEQKKFEEHKRLVEKFDQIANTVVDFQQNWSFVEEPFKGEILDCRDLPLEELDEHVARHMPTMRGIMDGEVSSERHKRYNNRNPRRLHITQELTYSTSLIVFTHRQKERMLDLLGQALDPEDKLTNYFFKVLLPELCLLVFMDVHQMDKAEALDYLDKRPIDG